MALFHTPWVEGELKMGSTRFSDMTVYRKAYQLTLDIYKVTRKFPVEERYCLAQQMRRAGISVPSNIAEGFARQGPKEKAYFYSVAKGSVEELKVQMMLTKDLGYASDVSSLQSLADEVCAMLYSLRQRVLAGY